MKVVINPEIYIEAHFSAIFLRHSFRNSHHRGFQMNHFLPNVNLLQLNVSNQTKHLNSMICNSISYRRELNGMYGTLALILIFVFCLVNQWFGLLLWFWFLPLALWISNLSFYRLWKWKFIMEFNLQSYLYFRIGRKRVKSKN